MVSRKLKALYYGLLSPLMRINAARHRMFPITRGGTAKAHLGPGQKNYLAGWINVDANLVSSKPDVWADMRYRLPFPDESLDVIYSHHMIEHLPDLDFHFREMFRCLRPGGMIRVGGPHGDNAIIAFQAGRQDWFGEWPVKRTSIGGKFENFIFCKGEHLTILTGSLLEEICKDSGFTGTCVVNPKETDHPEMIGQDVFDIEIVEDKELQKTLIVEAQKPRS